MNRNRKSNIIWLLLLLAGLLTLMLGSPAAAADVPFTIDGNVPDAGADIDQLEDPEGNTKELGPDNQNTTKLAVIDDDIPPTLGRTNPNGQVDLADTWIGTREDSHGNVWFYFAWLRDSNKGSGVITVELGANAPPEACDYTLIGTAQEQTLIDNCNPWENRATGDTLFLWDQQGNNIIIQQRTFDDANDTWGPTSDLDASVAVADFSDDGFYGEVAINLTATIFEAGTCFSVGNIIPGTITGNSDQADYKDTVLGDTDINIANCGKVIIRKQTEPDGESGTFDFTSVLDRPSGDNPSFSLSDDGVQTYNDVLIGTGYSVTESALASGFTLSNIDCSASTNVSANIGADTDFDAGDTTVSFDIDQATDILDCTYTNQALGSITIVKDSNPEHEQDFSFTGTGPNAYTFGGGFSLDDDAEGTLSNTVAFTDLPIGDYTVTEGSVAGWYLTGITCSDELDAAGASTTDLTTSTASISLQSGEDVTCTFKNETGAIRINKTAKDASQGGVVPQSGVDFTIKLGEVVVASATTDNLGTACVDGLEPGVTYSVLEDVPDNYAAASDNPQDVMVTAGATCNVGTPDVVNFLNDPLSKIVISFESLAGDGVTKVTSISCTGPSADGSEQGPLEHLESATFTDLVEGTYICTIVVDP